LKKLGKLLKLEELGKYFLIANSEKIDEKIGKFHQFLQTTQHWK
jgi:hypothetical protein